MSFKAIICVALLLVIPPPLMAKGGDHLLPEAAYLTDVDEYSFALRKLFSIGFDRDVVLRIMSFPSFGAESMLGIRKSEENSYSVFLLIPESSVKNKCHDPMGHPMEVDLKSISVRNIIRKIPDKLAEKIIEVISREILRAKFDLEPPVSIDGTRYSFSINIRPHFMTGARLISYGDGSRMNTLAALSDDLIGYAQGLKDEASVNSYLKVLSR